MYVTKNKNMKKILPFFLCAFVSVSLLAVDGQAKMPWYKSLFFGSGQEKATLSTMNYEQLCEAKQRAVEKKDRSTAIKYLDRMAKLCPNAQELRIIVLELADLLFEEGKYEKAYLIYDQYVKNYPGNSVDYIRAHYQKIVCSYYQVLDFDRDQTITEKTLELCEQFSETCKNSAYEQEVSTMVVACKKKLAHHELYIAQQYMISNDAIAVSKRLAHVRDAYLMVPDVEQQLLLVEVAFAEKVGNSTFAQAKKAELAEKYPQQSVVVAQTPKAKHMANRF